MRVASRGEELGTVAGVETFDESGPQLLMSRGHETLLDVMDGHVTGEGEELGYISVRKKGGETGEAVGCKVHE